MTIIIVSLPGAVSGLIGDFTGTGFMLKINSSHGKQGLPGHEYHSQ